MRIYVSYLMLDQLNMLIILSKLEITQSYIQCRFVDTTL